MKQEIEYTLLLGAPLLVLVLAFSFSPALGVGVLFVGLQLWAVVRESEL